MVVNIEHLARLSQCIVKKIFLSSLVETSANIEVPGEDKVPF
jgi:hypothetical protein